MYERILLSSARGRAGCVVVGGGAAVSGGFNDACCWKHTFWWCRSFKWQFLWYIRLNCLICFLLHHNFFGFFCGWNGWWLFLGFWPRKGEFWLKTGHLILKIQKSRLFSKAGLAGRSPARLAGRLAGPAAMVATHGRRTILTLSESVPCADA